MNNNSLRFIAFVMLSVGVLIVVAALRDLSRSGREVYTPQEINLIAVPTATGPAWSTSQDVPIVTVYEVEAIR